MDKKPSSTRPDIGQAHFQLSKIRSEEINKKWSVVHYLRYLIEKDWGKTGKSLPLGRPQDRFYKNNNEATSTRPDIGKYYFELAWIRTEEINKSSLGCNWHVVHYLRFLIEQDWKETGRQLPDGLPHKAFYLDLDL